MAFIGDHPLFTDPPAEIHPFSKDITGITLVVAQRPRMENCGGVFTSKSMHNFTARLVSHPLPTCEDALTSWMNIRITSTDFVNVLMNDGLGKGYHRAAFSMVDGNRAIAKGHMWGITNAGTHRIPTSSCERCNRQGHMEGRAHAKFTGAGIDGYELYASYIMDFNTSPVFFQGAVGSMIGFAGGAMDGIVLRFC